MRPFLRATSTGDRGSTNGTTLSAGGRINLTLAFRMRTLLPLFVALAWAGPLAAQADERAYVPADDPVLQRLEDLAHLPWLRNDPFTADTAALNVHGFAPDAVPTYPPVEMRRRLTVLDHRTPFALTYNSVVQSYIDLYALRKRDQTSRMLGLAELYFPVFEEALDRHGLPQELKYLAVVESALNPAARSRAAAVGLWQFIVGTGKLYGLRVDSYVDERSDVYKSTDAACRYLKDLYRIFGDWEMALAAYNCGPGNVNKAIRRSGGHKDYWKVYEHLPRETRGYVPAFIAVNYIFEHAADHNLYPIIPNYCAYEVDTVQVCYPLTLAHLASITGGTEQELRDLNPVFKQGFVPDPDQPVTLYLPRDLVPVFLAREDSIRYATLHGTYSPSSGEAAARANTPGTAPTALKSAPSPTPTAAKVHTVRNGETLGAIAKRYRVSVTQLRSWNGLRSDNIRVGQKLRVESDARGAAPEQRVPAARTADAGEDGYLYHVVQPGDTLWDIARKYPGVSVEDLKRMNTELKGNSLKPGVKIRVGVQKG